MDILQPESFSDLSGTATAIIIRCNVQKARVFLNGNYQGITPLTISGLIPGTYKLTVQKEDLGEFSGTILVKRSLSQLYYIELKKPLP